MIRFFFTVVMTLWLGEIAAQIVVVEPAFFTVDSTITVTYDATQGSGSLKDVNQFYTHTGVITSSGGAGNWQNVQGNWGTDDAKVKMTNIGDNKHQITYNVRDFYGLSGDPGVVQLSFVFRNVDGSKEGKTTTGGDIFVDLPELDEFNAFFRTPQEQQIVVEEGDRLNIEVVASEEADIIIYANEEIIKEGRGNQLSIEYVPELTGDYVIRFEARANGALVEGSFSFVYQPFSFEVDPPMDLELGLNRVSSTEVIIALQAPLKRNIILLSNINDYKVQERFVMNRVPDEDVFWILISDLNPNQDYNYQFLVDGAITIADPLSELVLDPDHDSAVNNFKNLPSYPEGQASGRVSYFKTETSDFNWTDQNFQSVKKTDLVVYEILLRDFLTSHSYVDLIDTLSYLKDLGVNAIELMPIQEYEANDSWGYNPTYHMALDKYYGSPEDFKKVVNAAHEMGISVIVDVVFNHSFGQSPLVQMYWDRNNNRPAADSPYFNSSPKHPFNVGFDFNHESDATREYVRRCLSYWIEEYHIDGYRFDLSKGFTQNFSANNNEMSAYDASRVSILTDYANYIWSINPNHLIILEHFASNTEERELAEKGMLFWGNGNFNFNEATMGYHDSNKSDFTWQSYQQRGWSDPNIIGYMESHDEERLMYKNLQFGNSATGYNVKNLATALKRNEMAAVFFFSIPGPKMVWQFGELGYDQSINRCVDGQVRDCRLDRKPIRWEYQNEGDRAALKDVYTKMIDLKVNNDLWETRDFELDVAGPVKTIRLNDLEQNAVILGNFDVSSVSATIDFQHDGIWYDVFGGDSITVSNRSYAFNMAPGAYHLFVDDNADVISSTSSLEDVGINIKIYPNPAIDILNVAMISDFEKELHVQIIDINGRQIGEGMIIGRDTSDDYEVIDVANLVSGYYFLRIRADDATGVYPFFVK